MKKTVLFQMLFALLLSVVTIPILHAQSAQSQEQKARDKWLKMFSVSLHHEIPGIVEGTIYNIIVCKKEYPHFDYSNIADILSELSTSSRDASIRYKALLASMYLSQASSIQVTVQLNPDNHGYIFKQIADGLSENLLSAR